MKLHYGINEVGEILPQLLIIMVPVILLQLIMMAVALISLFRKKLSFQDKIVWLILILVVAIIGPVVYFAVGSKMLDDKVSNGRGDEW